MNKKLTGTIYILIAASLWGSMGIFSRYLNAAGFGAFEVKERAARTGRNPKTGEAVEIPASKYVAFSAGSQLKDKVNA